MADNTTEKRHYDEGAESDHLDFDAILSMHKSNSMLESPVEAEFMSRFLPFFESLGSTHFNAHELAFLGPSNSGMHKCANKNDYPEESLWGNLTTLVLTLDSIREELGHPIRLSSIYRAEAYNSCIGGVVDSQHRKFTAADCVVGAASNMDLYAAAKRVRNSGVFVGGIGLYNTFVHIDVRGVNADWSRVPT